MSEFRERAIQAHDAEQPPSAISEAHALMVVMMRLRRHAWGGQPMHIEDPACSAKALLALEHLIELRDQAIEMGEAFKAWEFEQQQADERKAAAQSMATPLLDRWRECVLEDRRQTPLARGAAWEYAALKCTLDGDTNGAAVACERAEAAVTPRKRSSAA
jgi:hypothetical protein